MIALCRCEVDRGPLAKVRIRAGGSRALQSLIPINCLSHRAPYAVTDLPLLKTSEAAILA
jgi:hypothetical protein